MFVIIGILVVCGAVVGGFLMEKGQLLVLVQPSEFIIIGGAAIGAMVAANPLHVITKIFGGAIGLLKGSPFSKARYLEALRMMFNLFNKARREGVVAIESDIEDPGKSPVLSKYPAFIKDHHIRDFVCDTMRMTVTGGATAFDIDQMMELDMEVHHAEAAAPSSALNTMADSLPGMGIVAAVLGVVITMGALGGPPEAIGHKVAAALVGTFLGILLCYGIVGPMASNMSKIVDDEHAFYHVLKVSMLAFIKGMSPIMAVEMGRRAIPARVRPSFQEVEKGCRQKDDAVAKAA
jgi:chemotaxis protein MotA